MPLPWDVWIVGDYPDSHVNAYSLRYHYGGDHGHGIPRCERWPNGTE